ncbi:MAG: hypothetical protein LBB88_10585, partial [Planctomycetaceae bacterium]|nr:hypothetical protein [Planctomycetaceae bacterium]
QLYDQTSCKINQCQINVNKSKAQQLYRLHFNRQVRGIDSLVTHVTHLLPQIKLITDQVGDRRFATFRRKVALPLADGKSELILIIGNL